MDEIQITGIKGFGRHGVFEHERINGQDFRVDVKIYLDLTRASKSDELFDTVDYGSITILVVKEIEGEPVNLIERLAGRIAERLLKEFTLIERIEVCVHKPSAPVDQDVSDISVRVERSR